VAEAYEILKDDEKRAAYDRGDDVQMGGPGGFGGHPGFQNFQGGGGGGWTFSFTMG
jgi:DnaJ homolog subfamily C member 3